MYCKVDDIARAIGTNMLAEATEESKGSGIVDKTVEDIILSQSNYIDSYLHGRYLLPITDLGDLSVLFNICIILVIDELYSRRLIELPESFLIRKRSAIADLEKIAKGIIVLNSPRLIITGAEGTRYNSVSKRRQIFTDETLRNLI